MERFKVVLLMVCVLCSMCLGAARDRIDQIVRANPSGQLMTDGHLKATVNGETYSIVLAGDRVIQTRASNGEVLRINTDGFQYYSPKNKFMLDDQKHHLNWDFYGPTHVGVLPNKAGLLSEDNLRMATIVEDGNTITISGINGVTCKMTVDAQSHLIRMELETNKGEYSWDYTDYDGNRPRKVMETIDGQATSWKFEYGSEPAEGYEFEITPSFDTKVNVLTSTRDFLYTYGAGLDSIKLGLPGTYQRCNDTPMFPPDERPCVQEYKPDCPGYWEFLLARYACVYTGNGSDYCEETMMLLAIAFKCVYNPFMDVCGVDTYDFLPTGIPACR